MKSVPPILIQHFKSKGYTHVGGRLFTKSGAHFVLFDDDGKWSLSPCWVAEVWRKPVAAE